MSTEVVPPTSLHQLAVKLLLLSWCVFLEPGMDRLGAVFGCLKTCRRQIAAVSESVRGIGAKKTSDRGHGDTDSGELGTNILASGSWEPILDVNMVLICSN